MATVERTREAHRGRKHRSSNDGEMQRMDNEEKTEETGTLVRDLLTFKDEVSEALDDVHKTRIILWEKKQELKSNVKQYFNQLRQILDTEEENVTEEISELFQVKEAANNDLETSLEEIKDEVRVAEGKMKLESTNGRPDVGYVKDKLSVLKQRFGDMGTADPTRPRSIFFRENDEIVGNMKNASFGKIGGFETENEERSDVDETCADQETEPASENEINQAARGESDTTEPVAQNVDTVSENEQTLDINTRNINTSTDEQSSLSNEDTSQSILSDHGTVLEAETVLLPSAPPMVQVIDSDEPPPAYWEVAGFYPPSAPEVHEAASMLAEHDTDLLATREIRARHQFHSRLNTDGKIGAVSLIWREKEFYVLDRFNKNLKIFNESGYVLHSLTLPTGEPFNMAYRLTSQYPHISLLMVVVPKDKCALEVTKTPVAPPAVNYVVGTGKGYTSIAWSEKNEFYVCGTSEPFSSPQIDMCRFNRKDCIMIRTFRDNILGYPRCIATIENFAIISDWRANHILMVELSSGVSKTYRGSYEFPLKNVRDVTIDGGGDILVLDESSRNIHVLSTECELLDVVTLPWSVIRDPRLIAYKPGDGTHVAVANFGGDVLTLHFQKHRRQLRQGSPQDPYSPNEPVSSVPGMLAVTLNKGRSRSYHGEDNMRPRAQPTAPPYIAPNTHIVPSSFSSYSGNQAQVTSGPAGCAVAVPGMLSSTIEHAGKRGKKSRSCSPRNRNTGTRFVSDSFGTMNH